VHIVVSVVVGVGGGLKPLPCLLRVVSEGGLTLATPGRDQTNERVKRGIALNTGTARGKWRLRGREEWML
jgi:hypothetical protein